MWFLFFIFTDFNCSRVSCKTECPAAFNRLSQVPLTPEVFFYLQNYKDAHTKELYKSQSRAEASSLNLLICCNFKCKQSCITLDNEIVPNGTEWVNPEDPCTSHICNNGIISNHTSACSGLPCGLEYQIKSPSECCSRCDSNWASFCPEPEHVDCDMVCQYGFEVDQQRKCDLCRCAKRIDETLTSAITTSEPTSNDDASKTVHFYFYLDPSDGATKYLTIGLAFACCVILVACLAAFGWYFHRKVYKKVPLLSFRNSSA